MDAYGLLLEFCDANGEDMDDILIDQIVSLIDRETPCARAKFEKYGTDQQQNYLSRNVKNVGFPQSDTVDAERVIDGSYMELGWHLGENGFEVFAEGRMGGHWCLHGDYTKFLNIGFTADGQAEAERMDADGDFETNFTGCVLDYLTFELSDTFRKMVARWDELIAENEAM